VIGEIVEGKEVILAAGAIGSPHLMLLSGIGPAEELRTAGVEPRHELAGVGKHLEDHLLMAVTYRADCSHKLSMANMLLWMARHMFGGGGPMGAAPVDGGAFVKSSPSERLPNIQFHASPWGVRLPTDSGKPTPGFGRFATILPGLIYPRSHGELRLRSSNPLDAPMIDPQYLRDRADLDHLVEGVKLSREIAATGPLKDLLGEETFPGPGVTTDDQIRESVLAHCNTIFHPVGTCRMGTGSDAVVDPDLRVHGLRGLRVADASVMPRIIGGNTNAPTIMIAEKCADLAMN
jgi:choline dehydrogenase